ncbi:MAG: hypothetical protein AAGA54_36210 [Myxococcota bacterium]
MTPLTLSHPPQEHQYIRVCFGSESGEPWMTLYEVDCKGQVLRHVQVHAEGCRFAPEDILLCSPVNAEAMLTHPTAETIGASMFDLLWSELAEERTFNARIPDREQLWEGYVRVGDQDLHVMWNPDGFAIGGWTPVPGFDCMFVQGSMKDAQRVCAGIFIEAPIRWQQLSAAAA